MPVTSRILGHIFCFQPSLPVAVKTILRSCARMKRGVQSPCCLPSSLARKSARIQRASGGQYFSSRIRLRLAGWTTR
ncbi:MAG: hypothetical protein OJF58_003748 [Enhydrobacter sp.]|nr:MAG: hypothetical protein OJF58_003748 [Enhydrobacter sp.]